MIPGDACFCRAFQIVSPSLLIIVSIFEALDRAARERGGADRVHPFKHALR